MRRSLAALAAGTGGSGSGSGSGGRGAVTRPFQAIKR